MPLFQCFSITHLTSQHPKKHPSKYTLHPTISVPSPLLRAFSLSNRSTFLKNVERLDNQVRRRGEDGTEMVGRRGEEESRIWYQSVKQTTDFIRTI